MIARDVWSLFLSLPLSVAAGRFAGRVTDWSGRKSRPIDDGADAERRVGRQERRINAVKRAPQAYIDQVLMARQVELAGDDLEEADHARRP